MSINHIQNFRFFRTMCCAPKQNVNYIKTCCFVSICEREKLFTYMWGYTENLWNVNVLLIDMILAIPMLHWRNNISKPRFVQHQLHTRQSSFLGYFRDRFMQKKLFILTLQCEAVQKYNINNIWSESYYACRKWALAEKLDNWYDHVISDNERHKSQ